MTIFTDFLRELGVPHTQSESDKAFYGMTFKSLFGFSRLLNSYGISSSGVEVAQKSDLRKLPLPFLAQLGSRFVIVTGFEGEDIRFVDNHHPRTLSPADFNEAWNGVALLAKAEAGASEPDYKKHRLLEIAKVAKKWIFMICVLFLGAVGFIESGLWRHLSTIFLTCVDIAGICITWLLVLKSMKVNSKSADRICGVLEAHGCDTVLEQKASKFFGLFGWSEVGISYFTVSTLVLLIYPQYINWLALANGCCLPFTIWSIWYQKFRIKTWCTLCVTTQCLLWLQFFCYFFGGWWQNIFPLRLPFFLLIAAYGAVLMGVNRVMEHVESVKKD